MIFFFVDSDVNTNLRTIHFFLQANKYMKSGGCKMSANTKGNLIRNILNSLDQLKCLCKSSTLKYIRAVKFHSSSFNDPQIEAKS